MAWFKRKERSTPETVSLVLSQMPQIEGPGYVLRATRAPAGFKSRGLATVAEFNVTHGAGWFLAEDLKAFFNNKIPIVESWTGSQSELFLCRQTSIPPESMAAAALEAQPEFPEGSALLLRQLEGKLEIVLYLDIAQLDRISLWVQELPKF